MFKKKHFSIDFQQALSQLIELARTGQVRNVLFRTSKDSQHINYTRVLRGSGKERNYRLDFPFKSGYNIGHNQDKLGIMTNIENGSTQHARFFGKPKSSLKV